VTLAVVDNGTFGERRLKMVLELPRKSKGHRPKYFEDAAIDRVLAITLSLAGEVSVLRDRIDTIERLSSLGKPFGPVDVDSFEPSAEIATDRERWRANYLEQVLLVIQQDVDDLKRPHSAHSYEAAVKSVENT